jgi:hypothetical protein
MFWGKITLLGQKGKNIWDKVRYKKCLSTTVLSVLRNVQQKILWSVKRKDGEREREKGREGVSHKKLFSVFMLSIFANTVKLGNNELGYNEQIKIIGWFRSFFQLIFPVITNKLSQIK